MHFFIDHTLLPTQVEADAYGPDAANPNTQYNVSAKFILTSTAKAFACEAGMLVVQQSDLDASLVNVIIEPTSAQSTVSHKVKYYIYRGILKTSLIDGENITAKNTNNNDLIKRIYNARLEVVLYTAGVIGYDSTLLGTQNINEIFKSSNIGLNPIKVNEGEWFGQFAPVFSCGFEVILEPDKIDVNLSFVRQGPFSINVTGLTGLALRAKKETILAFIDPTAFFGLYYKEGLNITTYTVANETTPSTATTVKKKETELYTDILSKFFTKDRTYLDIRSDKGYSYNFYQDYNFIAFNNNPQSQNYETLGWPIIFQNNILTLSLKLRTDGNVKPIIYIEQKQLIGEKQKTPFIEDLIDSLNIGWTKEIILLPPYKPYYIQFYYYHKIIDQASLSPFVKNNRYYHHAFCSIDLLPNNFDSPTLKNKKVENSNPVFISESLQGNGTGGFSYIANNGAYWDNNKVLFYATMQSQYKSSGKKYPNPAKTRKLDIVNNAYNNEVGSVLQINTRLFANNQQAGPHEENIKLLNIGSCEASGAKDQDACLFLGLSIAETAAIKTTANGLSQQHQRYIYLAPESTNTPTFFTLHSNDTPIPLYQYQVKVQGLDANGNLAYLIPSKPGAPVGTPILVYSIDQFFYHSKAFSENEEPTLTSNQTEFHIYHNGTIKADTLLPGHIGKKVKYIYHDKNNTQHIICELVVSQIDGVENGKKGPRKGVSYTDASIPPNAIIKTGISGETNSGTYYYYPNKDIWVKGDKGIIFYKSTGKQAFMVKFSPVLIQPFTIEGKTLNIVNNPGLSRFYINPQVCAAMLGSMISTIQFQHMFNGGAHSIGTSYPSVSHSNGMAFDYRYQQYLISEKMMADTNQAREDNRTIISAMQKFGFSEIIVGNATRYTALLMSEKNKIVKKLANHNNHIHIYKLINLCFIFFFMASLLLASCNNKKQTKLDNAKKIIKNKNTSNTNNTQISGNFQNNLPFGSKYLIDIPFPEVFQFQSYSESEVVTKEDQAFADAFDKADEYYNSLNKKKVINTIIFKNVEYIKLRHKYFSNDSLRISKAKVLGVHRKFWPLDSLPYTLGNVIYKLPNFESYKCFYAYKKLFGGPTEWDDPKPVERPFLEIGNLIFNNPLNGSTKVVNIFFKADVGGFIGYERFFYIDSAKKIHIFSTTSDEEYTYFHKECTIKVLNNGEIKVSYLK